MADLNGQLARVARLEGRRGLAPVRGSTVVVLPVGERLPGQAAERAHWLASLRRARRLAPGSPIMVIPANGR